MAGRDIVGCRGFVVNFEFEIMNQTQVGASGVEGLSLIYALNHVTSGSVLPRNTYTSCTEVFSFNYTEFMPR